MSLLHFLSQPLALDESMLRLLLAHAVGQQHELSVRAFGRTDSSFGQARSDKIAVLRIVGLMVPRESWMNDVIGATSTDLLRQRIREATLDPTVASIVLDTDSPGGLASGTSELAKEIMIARSVKPTIAVVRHLAASAAYWAISGATEIVVEPDGAAGSIGVYRIHEDISKLLERRGVNVSIIRSSGSPKKIEDNPLEPLADDTKAHLQRRVDDAFASFVTSVAIGRRISPQRVLDRFGAGRVFGADDLVSRGMADRIGTLEDTLDRLGAGGHASAASRQFGGSLGEISGSLADIRATIARARRALDEKQPHRRAVRSDITEMSNQLDEIRKHLRVR